MGRFFVEFWLLGRVLAIGSIFDRDLAFGWIFSFWVDFGRVTAIGSIFGRDLGFGSSFRFGWMFGFWVDFL